MPRSPSYHPTSPRESEFHSPPYAPYQRIPTEGASRRQCCSKTTVREMSYATTIYHRNSETNPRTHQKHEPETPRLNTPQTPTDPGSEIDPNDLNYWLKDETPEP